jgi:hypothetical protein
MLELEVELAVPLVWLASSWAIALALVLLMLLMSMKVPFVLVVAPLACILYIGTFPSRPYLSAGMFSWLTQEGADMTLAHTDFCACGFGWMKLSYQRLSNEIEAMHTAW